MRAAIRRLVPTPVKTAARAATALTMFSDVASVRRYARCRDHQPQPDAVPHTIRVHVRKLGGAAVTLRTAGSDARVLFDAFVHEYHLPPPEAAAAMRRRDATAAPLIFDLGANIGLTMAHYAHLFPSARIVGVELDEANAAQCRLNVAPWSDRCTVVEGAVWIENGFVEYELQGEAQYAMAARPVSGVEAPSIRRAPALTIASLLASYAGDRPVDYVKMDVEGAERELLRSGAEWAARVRCLKVELHGGYDVAACVADLRRLGFSARSDVERAHCVIAVRA